MKIIGRVYICFLLDYNMLVLETLSNHQRGIALSLRESPLWQIKAHKSFGPHVLSFQLVTGQKEWFIIRCYALTGSVADTEHTTMALDNEPLLPACHQLETEDMGTKGLMRLDLTMGGFA